MRHRLSPRHGQHGTTLLEALVAFLVLSLGMLSVVRVQTQLRLHADVARQRSEAVRIGQQDLETLRAFAVVGASGALPSFAQITSAARDIDNGTRYQLERLIGPLVGSNAKSAVVSVGWTDRSGTPQQVALSSVISATDPAFSGALALAPSARSAKNAYGRALGVPLTAKDLGDGRSAERPAIGAPVWVFDNLSGAVVASCTPADATLATRDLTLANLGPCAALAGQSLSGVVRFASTSPPDPAQARRTPLALGMAMTLTGATYPIQPPCSSEAKKTVSYAIGGTTRTEAVPIDAVPASVGAATWTDLGDRFVAYQCVVVPPAGAPWSGRSEVVPSGWRIGSTAGQYRVCRYSADLDASGAVDANVEHPAAYTDVGSALANQNFLVIAGNDDCPAGGLDGSAARRAALATAAHQPP